MQFCLLKKISVILCQGCVLVELSISKLEVNHLSQMIQKPEGMHLCH